MRKQRISFRLLKLLKMLLPVLLLLALATIGVSIWLAYWVTKPPRRAYLVTPEKFSTFSDRGVKVTEETWANSDGTQARGWLLRGAAGAPAVILLHRYGADRSWLLNLGVKLNEATNFTVLWPDLRGHGQNPTVKTTTFGSREAEDVGTAVNYLGTLKTAQGGALVGDQIGIYGVELGAYAAVMAAGRDTGVRSLALDSIPSSPDQLLRTVVKERTGFDNGLVYFLARIGMRIYFLNRNSNADSCTAASTLKDRRVLLLAGPALGELHDSTMALARCFPDPSLIEVDKDLVVAGPDIPTATSQQSEAFDRRVIEFFNRSLRMKP